MATRAVFSEHDSEPVRGLPAVLPEGERVLWQGAPDWRSLALNAYHVRTLAYYFGAIVLARGIYLVSTGSSIGDALQGCVGPAVFSLIGLGLLTGVAALAARSTLYTITNRRIVLRQGIALSSSLNLPLVKLHSANLRHRGDGSGDIALVLLPEERVSYLWLWPHVRTLRMTRPQPMLRSLTDVQEAGRILSRAFAAVVSRSHITVDQAQPQHSAGVVAVEGQA
ncbi:MAG: PH domain-containing protein [Gammaproteobacteria bacterium]|nr:PH domain-containing protein [Gammaproteobacteria bacterium]